MADTEGAPTGAPTPADNAATVRQALKSAMCGEWGKRNALDKLDALLAQAEAGEELKSLLKNNREAWARTCHDLAAVKDERDRLEKDRDIRMQSQFRMQDERDAAVRERDQAREALEVLYRLLAANGADVKPYNVGEDALDRVERLATDMETALERKIKRLEADIRHLNNANDDLRAELRARAVLSAREEGAAP